MIILEDKKLDIFKVDCQTIALGCNKVGVMGNGLALAFKNRFEGLEEAYKRACYFDVFKSSGVFIFDVKGRDKKVMCFPTKNHWKYKSPIELIDFGLEKLSRQYTTMGITSLALPALGCGKGQIGRNNHPGDVGFEWNDVRKLIYEYLDPLPLPVTLIPPR